MNAGIGVPAALAEAVRRQLDEGVDGMDARAVWNLLDTRIHIDALHRSARGLPMGPLAGLTEVTCEAVYGRLEQLRAVRRAVDMPSDTDVVTSLVTLVNVLLASDVALRVERRYADAERSAMMAAVLAELRGDEQGVDAARAALAGAARDALSALESGSEPMGPVPVPAAELLRADLVARLRDEVPTGKYMVADLKRAARCLVNIHPEDNPCFGPLLHAVDPVTAEYSRGPLWQVHEDMRRPLSQAFVARQQILRDWQPAQTVTELAEQLVALLIVVLAADGAAAIEVAYMDAEARAMSLAAVAQLRGDAQGVAAQADAMRQAAATVVRMMQRRPDVPSDAQLIDRLLLAQIGS